MTEWSQVRLDALGTVERGRSRHRPRNDPALYDGPYPFVQTGDIKAAGLRLFDYTQTYSEAGLAQSRLWPAGTLCFTIAANIGDTAILGIPACFPDSIVGFTPDPEVADVVFVKYVLDYAKLRFTSISRGATQDNLSLEKLLSQTLSVPPLDTQRRIAAILGAYDDLIEVNRRRVEVLEEMARGLFEEWFVRFRFPGHESVPIVDTPDGPLPEGWRRSSLTDIAEEVSYGFTAKAQQDGPGPKFLRITDIVNGPIRWQGVPHCEIDPKKLRRFALIPEDIVVARTGATVGHGRRVGRMACDAVYASYLVRFRFGTEYDPAIAAVFMQSDEYKSFVKTNAGGAAQPNANAKILGSAIVAVPDAKTQANFGSVVRPMQNLIDLLVAHSSALAVSRDLLLPRLISGQLSIETAERDLELAA